MGNKAKGKAAADAKAPARSEIIEQCLIYVQNLAAYDAGFNVDEIEDCSYASGGGHMKRAGRAMVRLILLNPHCRSGAPPVTAVELRAMAGVLSAAYGMRDGEDLNPIESAYIRLFAGSVSDLLRDMPKQEVLS